jgi:hypothetical protein
MFMPSLTYYRLLGVLGILCLVGLSTIIFYLQKHDIQDFLRADQMEYNVESIANNNDNVDIATDQHRYTKPSSWWQGWWPRSASWRGQSLTNTDTSIEDNEGK